GRAMFPGMIGETPYDLRWRMFGIRVRVHPLFWVMAALINWNLLELGIQYLVVGVACVFVSILLHELGHVVVGNLFGSRGHIILGAFGGLAVGSIDLRSRWQRIAVSFAGPGAQLILWAVLQYVVVPGLTQPLELMVFTNTLLWATLSSLLFINLYWPLLNLLPIWPLDGGMITRDLVGWFTPRNAVCLSLQISILVSAL